MTDSNEDRLELLERRLSENVTERVRSALFTLYATAGVAVISVLGLIGWNFMDELESKVDEAKSSIIQLIESDIEPDREQIRNLVSESKILARYSNEIIQDVKNQLVEFEPQAKNLNDTIEKVKSLAVEDQDFRALYLQELKPVIKNVESISGQIKLLAEQVNQLNLIVSKGGSDSAERPVQTDTERTSAIQSVISEVQEADIRLKEASKRATVFFQFAGGSRAQAEAISASLRGLSYNVPREDRERDAVKKHEVRFFHEDDRINATKFVADINKILGDLEYNPDTIPEVKLNPYISYSGKKPREGVLELWLEIPMKK